MMQLSCTQGLNWGVEISPELSEDKATVILEQDKWGGS